VRRPLRWVIRGMGIVLVTIIVVALLGVAVMLLWNALVPTLFRGPSLEYWQAVGLLILSRLLFGGLRGRGGRHGPWRGGMWRERWEQLTPEERARLRERLLSRCGRGAGDPAAVPPAAPPPRG
jgi:hypothetical protein